MILSLYDFTGEAVKPWAEMGFKCVCFDIQHSKVSPRVEGNISYLHADLHNRQDLTEIALEYENKVKFLMAWPDCTDMAVSGSRHFEKKRGVDPLFQIHASDHARMCGNLGEIFGCPWMVENPRSVLSTFWRKPDHSFNPFDYGGYIEAVNAFHPTYPEYISPFDAYPKETFLWTGGRFVMPDKKPVHVNPGYSDQFKKLGGKSLKTKNIRSATPRGFAKAVMLSNLRSCCE